MKTTLIHFDKRTLTLLRRMSVLMLSGQTLLADKPLTKLEEAVRSGPRIHEVNKAAAKPGERPHAYGSPGREKHHKGPPPGQEKKKP